MKAKTSLTRTSISCSPLRYGLFLTSLALPLIGGLLERSTNAAFPGQNGKIAFQSSRSGNFAIFVVNPDGSGLTQLTFGGANNGAPSWSPDGSKIVFTSDRDGNFEIYSMNADDSNVTRLTNNPATDVDPAWSPDGTRIAFDSDRDGDREIYTMNPTARTWCGSHAILPATATRTGRQMERSSPS